MRNSGDGIPNGGVTPIIPDNGSPRSEPAFRGAVWLVRLVALVLARLAFTAVLTGLACHRPDAGHELLKLDRQVLTTFDKLLEPIPRFTGSLPLEIARFRPTAGGKCPPAQARPELPKLNAAQRRELADLGRAVARLARTHNGEPALLRLKALWTLIASPSPEGRRKAIRLFQEALARQPKSLQRRNDIAAAYLLQASLDGQTVALAAALELLNSSEPTEPRPSAAVLVNRAYAFQCLTLWQDAQEIWRQLPQAARKRSVLSLRGTEAAAIPGGLAPLRHAVVRDPLSRRRQGEWLLGEWGARSLRGEAATSRRFLQEAEAIGASLEARQGDRLLLAAIGVIRQAESRGDQRTLLSLQQGHAAFHSIRGNALYSQCRPEILHLAETELTTAQSPFVGWVRLDEAICAYYDREFPRGEAILTALEHGARRRGELALQGRTEWVLGLIRMVQARFIEADRYYAEAIEIFSRLGEEAHVVFLRSLRAKSYEYGGSRPEAWRERLAALLGRGAIGEPERLFTIFDEAAQALEAQGYRIAALGFRSEQMRAAEVEARGTGRTDLLAFTLLGRAALLSEIGRQAAAAADLLRAEGAWSRLPPANLMRPRLRVEIDLQRALFDGRADGARRLAAVDRAMDFFAGQPSSLGNQIQLLKLYQLRARIDQERGNFAAARGDLLRGVAEVERQRLEVATMEDRARFLMQSRQLFLDLVRLDLDKFHDPLAALEIFERSSNRVLADLAQAHAEEGARRFDLRPDMLRDALPAGTLVLRFGHLRDRLLVWTLLDGHVELEQRPVSEAELSRQVKGCREPLARRGPRNEWEAACDLLAQTLLPRRLRDFAAQPGVRQVLVVPDEIVAPLPLAALRTAPRGPYLIERVRLSYTPSLAFCLNARKRSNRVRLLPLRSALFVSDPAFNSDFFSSLERLPAARRSVAVYAAHYRKVKVLSDREATVPAVLAELDRFNLLQFDGHGLVNTQYPERSGLLLAPIKAAAEDAASSLLTARDLTPRSLRRLRLVVLGACSTGLTTFRDSAEVTGLAATFLARGVPEVVAAAWEVPDETTADLLDRFHRALSAGQPADAALRSAQLAILNAKTPSPLDSPVWAAFQVFRGGKPYAASVDKAGD